MSTSEISKISRRKYKRKRRTKEEEKKTLTLVTALTLDLNPSLTIRGLPADSLEGMRFAVFGLGDSGYAKYNAAARKLHARLLQLGAKELVREREGARLFFCLLSGFVFVHVIRDYLLQGTTVLLSVFFFSVFVGKGTPQFAQSVKNQEMNLIAIRVIMRLFGSGHIHG